MSWLILLPIIALVCGSAPAFADDDERYLSCMNSFDCGNITGAGYPFSGSDRPGYCGYPGFELSCRYQDPEITIMWSTNSLASTTSRGLSMFPEQITQKIYVLLSFPTPLWVQISWVPIQIMVKYCCTMVALVQSHQGFQLSLLATLTTLIWWDTL